MRFKPTFFTLTLFLIGCTTQGGSEPRPAAKSNITAPAFELTDLHGKKFSLKDFKGKIVFLDFWATWCPPCIMSIPEVGRLYEDYKSKDVEIISISVDNDVSSVLRFVESRKMKNRVAMALDSGIDQKYRVQGIPAFFVIDKEGKIVDIWEGYNSRMSSLWRKELDRLLGV